MEFTYSDKNPAATVAYASFKAMNTVMEIIMAGRGQDDSRRLCGIAETITRETENKFSRHIPGSDISRLNETGSLAVDEEVYMILELCETMRKATAGYFDISALSERRERPAYITDPQGRTVRLAGKDVILDLGGFAKGYALDKIRGELAGEGVENALLNFGNSSVLGMGTHPFGDCWQVGLETGAGDFSLRDSSLSVSGRSPSGVAHIVDPATGSAVSSDEKVAVKGRSALVCEILSTALYATPRAGRIKVIAAFDGYDFSSLRGDA